MDCEVAELCEELCVGGQLGAVYRGDGRCDFTVWAPYAQNVEIHFPNQRRTLELQREGRAYHRGTLTGVAADSRYLYRLDRDKERADPASRFQPNGVFGPSQVIDLKQFVWDDGNWRAP